jgi:hypothetical protein
MEKFALFLSVLAFIALMLFVGRWSVRRGRKVKFYKSLAQRYGGNVAGRFFSPRLWFRYGTTMGYLKSSRSRAHREQTVLILTWPDKRLRFDVATQDQSFKPHRHSEIIDSQEQGFSRELSIQANQPDEMRRMLSHGVRWKIEQLANQLGIESVAIRLSSGKLKIVKPGVIREFQQLDDLVRMGLELHDELLLTKSEGIDFVDDAEAKILGDVKCPICSEEVIEEMVICLRCKTPHCKDCWQYNGHCATFACNETRFYCAGGSAVS